MSHSRSGVSHFDSLLISHWKPKNPILHLRATLYGVDLTLVLVSQNIVAVFFMFLKLLEQWYKNRGEQGSELDRLGHSCNKM